MMKKSFIFLFIVLSVILTQIALADPFYYGQFNRKKMMKMNSPLLRKTLQKILSGYHLQRNNAPDVILGLTPPISVGAHQILFKHRVMPYLSAKAYLYKNIAPLKIDGVKHMPTIYCNDLFRFPKRYRNTQQLTRKLSVNAEHIWPKSRFTNGSKKKRMQSPLRKYQIADLHHIYPSLEKVNSARQSYMFAEIVPGRKSSQKSLNSAIYKMNYNSGDGIFGLPKTYPGARLKNKHDIYFEPPDSAKGQIARAILYFSIRYGRPINPTEFYFVKKWHIENPPTQAEMLRNDQVFDYQFVRNPFVDRPWLIDYLHDDAFLTPHR